MTEESKNYVKDRPTLIIDLPVGSKVMPLNTRTLDSHQQIDLTEVLSSMNRIERKDCVHIDVNRNVYTFNVKGVSRALVLNKQISH